MFRGWTLLVWLAAAALAIFLASTDTQFGKIMGVIETVAEPVAPLETARLTELKVVLGQHVKAGDLVATMDFSQVDAELSVIAAEAAEERDTISTYQRDILQMVSRGESAVFDSEAALETVKIQQAREAAELAELKKEQRRREEMVAKHLISEELASALRPAIAALEQSVAAGPATIKLQERRLEDAKKERDATRVWLRIEEGQDASAAIREKLKARAAISESRRKLAELRRGNYELRAAKDGIVSMILHNPGDVVPAGDPVLRIVSGSDHVVGFLPEVLLTELTVGEKVLISRSTWRGSRCSAVVESIGPEVDPLPGRVSPIRGQPVRGRRVLLKLTEAHDFIPGETVKISDATPFWPCFNQQIARFLGR